MQAKGDLAGAEPLFRRVLEGHERALGPAHPYTLTSLNNLAGLLDKTGRTEEAKPLRLRRLQAITTKADTPPLELRTAARDAYSLGDYVLAKSLLEPALAQGFEPPGTHVHLARIALVTGDPPGATDHASQAWAHRAEAPPYVVPRILWLQLAARLLAPADSPDPGPDPAVLLGRLKTALAVESAHVEWTMDPVLDRLKAELSPEDHALLTALVAALSFAGKGDDLEAIPAWRDAGSLPMD